MSKTLKWKDIWVTQTELGNLFNLSAIKIGKKLEELKLRDSISKLPTAKSISEDLCNKIIKKDGTVFYMWNKQKIKQIFTENNLIQVSKNEEIINKLITEYKRYLKIIDDGNDKLGYMALDTLFDEVPKNKTEEVKQLFIEKIKLLKLPEYY